MKGHIWRVVSWIYGVQLFLVVPWFLGSFYRGEQSVWFWKEYQASLRHFGAGNACLSVYLYLLFYSALVALPYWLLMLNVKRRMPRSISSARAIVFIVAFWIAVTLLFFAKSIFAFIHNLPDDVWNGWLLIGWIVITSFVTLLWRGISSLDKNSTHLDGSP